MRCFARRLFCVVHRDSAKCHICGGCAPQIRTRPQQFTRQRRSSVSEINKQAVSWLGGEPSTTSRESDILTTGPQSHLLEVEFKVSYILDLMMHEVCSNSRTVRPAGWRLCQLLMMFLSGLFNLKFLHVCNVYSGLWRVSKERKCSTKKRLLHWHSILVCCWFLYWHPITLVRCRLLSAPCTDMLLAGVIVTYLNEVPGPSNMAESIPGPKKALPWPECTFRGLHSSVCSSSLLISSLLHNGQWMHCIWYWGHKQGPKANLGDHRKKTGACQQMVGAEEFSQFYLLWNYTLSPGCRL